MNNRIYIVTGAAGFLGNNIVRKLLAQNQTVRGLILNPTDSEVFDKNDLELVCGDVRNIASLEPLFLNPNGCDLILIHAASVVTIASKFNQSVYDINVTGTKNLLQLCQSHSVKRFIHVSSVHAIPEPPNGEIINETINFSADLVHGTYAKTKAEASRLVLEKAAEGLDCCIVHPSGIIGCGDYSHTHLNQLVLDYLNGHLAASVKGGYDFVDVSDVADGVLACVDKGVAGSCYILSNRYYSIQEVLDKLQLISGKKPVRVTLPFWFAKLTAPLAEFYYRLLNQPPLFTAYSLYTLQCNSNFSHKKATSQLGYHPRELEETFKEMIPWLKAQHKI